MHDYITGESIASKIFHVVVTDTNLCIPRRYEGLELWRDDCCGRWLVRRADLYSGTKVRVSWSSALKWIDGGSNSESPKLVAITFGAYPAREDHCSSVSNTNVRIGLETKWPMLLPV